MAEVWGSLLRRLKPGAREEAVKLLAKTGEGIEDSTAWAVAFACKSVSQTLHTVTPSIFTALIDVYLTSEDQETTYTLIRRSVTALIHHVKNSATFAPLADLLVQRFTTTVGNLNSSTPPTEENIENLRRMLEILSIPTAVRQGSRLTQNQLSLLLGELSRIPLLAPLHSSLLKFCSATFTASEMPLWLGPGMKFFQRAWNETCPPSDASSLDHQKTPQKHDENSYKDTLHFVLSLNGTLASLSWGGWKPVALPLLLKNTSRPEVRASDPRGVLRLLASLKKAGKLGSSGSGGDIDVVWKGRVEEWALGRLKTFTTKSDITLDDATEIDDILTLTPLFSSAVCQPIVDIIKALIGSSNDDHKNSVSAWALGASLSTLSKRDASEWISFVTPLISTWTRDVASHWSKEPGVLDGLVSISQKITTSLTSTSFGDVYTSLSDSLLSHSQSLRLATLRLLGSGLLSPTDDVREAIARCLKGDEVSLDVQGVRERVLRIGRVVLGVKDKDEVGADIVARWLIAQLKVNLRPIWSPAAAALGALAERFGDLVWKLLFSEIQGLESESVRGNGHGEEDHKGQHVAGGEKDDPWEEERSWRDPSAHKLRSVVLQWLDNDFAQKELTKIMSSKDRLDLRAYESQLLATLGVCASLTERHNRVLVPHFLSLAEPISKLPKAKLTSWLTLFSKFTNPKALYSTETLHSL
ncbi:hypothetical protein H0H93_009222, partial [Arthromyces matolae]